MTGNRQTILLVDDEPGMLESIARFLEIEGLRVLAASNGAQAWQTLSENRCNLLFTDLSLPYMDGDELIRKVRSDPSYGDMDIILSSATPPPETGVLQLADVFLHRPFGITRLLEVIRLLLERRKHSSRS